MVFLTSRFLVACQRTMSDPNRIRRQQILREAEGYLDLITVFGDRMPCRRTPATRWPAAC